MKAHGDSIWNLPITFLLLENAVHKSTATFAKIGMREGKKVQQSFQVQEGMKIMGISTQQFHKQKSFYNRVMRNLNHRWLAYMIVKELFTNVFDIKAGGSHNNNSYLEFSYRFLNETTTRYNWLENLALLFFDYLMLQKLTKNLIMHSSKCAGKILKNYISGLEVQKST